MKRAGKIAICLAGGLALNAGLRAADLASTNNPLPDNPYAAIVVRNIFSLAPPPPPPDPSIAAENKLPKITPTGIMSFYGHSKVLFKVAGAPAKPGQPAKDEYYTLSQGQRQDDIEVIKIDEKNSIVTFNNHGTTQELPLVNTPSTGPAAASPSPVAGNPATSASPPGSKNNSPGAIIHFGGGSGGRAGSIGSGANNFSGGGGTGATGPIDALNSGGSMQGRTYQPEASTMTPEQTVIMIEAQRAQYQAQGSPIANLLPPTVLTKFNKPGGDNNPGEDEPTSP